MSKQITKTVYTLAELLADKSRQRAAERARNTLREVNTSDDWYDYTYDLWKAALGQIGFENADIQFSGFGSQGDGASFTASVNLVKLIEFLASDIEPNPVIDFDGKAEHFAPWVLHKLGKKPTNPAYRQLLPLIKNWDLEARIERHTTQYVHEKTCRFECELHGGRLELVSDLNRDADNLRIALCQIIYRMLEEEYNYLTSDEALIELATANDYYFDGVGRVEWGE